MTAGSGTPHRVSFSEGLTDWQRQLRVTDSSNHVSGMVSNNSSSSGLELHTVPGDAVSLSLKCNAAAVVQARQYSTDVGPVCHRVFQLPDSGDLNFSSVGEILNSTTPYVD